MILPQDEHLGNITYATGIYFDLFLHLILSTNILKSMVTSVVNWYTVSLTKLTEVAQSVTEMDLFKMEVSTCKYTVQVLCVPVYVITPMHKVTIPSESHRFEITSRY